MQFSKSSGIFGSLRKIAFDSYRGDIKENYDVMVGVKNCFMFDSLVITPVGLKSPVMETREKSKIVDVSPRFVPFVRVHFEFSF